MMLSAFPRNTVSEIPVPPGHVASVVTYLQRGAGPRLDGLKPLASSFYLEWTTDVTAADYKRLFRRVGGPWLWFSRLTQSDAALQSTLDEPARHLALLRDGDAVAGYVEMDGADNQRGYVSFIGVAPGYAGKGLGHYLMEHGIAKIWTSSTKSVSTHTCTLDHPQALAFYLRSGFVPIKRSVEVGPDPRVSGLLDRNIRPDWPIV